MRYIKMIAAKIKFAVLRLRLKLNPVQYARAIGVSVGSDCRFIGLDINTFGSEPYLIKIGDHVTITSGVRFITHDGGVWVIRRNHPNLDVIDSIEIGENVFIGMNSIILPGTIIGENTVIGAGSIVKGKYESNKVIAGVPARAIKGIDEYSERILRQGIDMRDKTDGEKREIFIEKCRRK